MELQLIIDQTLSGRLSLNQLQEWVETNRIKYRKPPLMDALHAEESHGDIERLVDEFSDWEIRMQELTRHLSKLNKAVYVPNKSNQTLLIAEVVFALSILFEKLPPKANGAFVLGYARWQAKEYYDAAEILSEAAELFRRAGDPAMEVYALSYRCDSLQQHKQYDETIECADDYINRARQYGFRGHEAMALRDRGKAHSALGRETEGLKSLRAAANLRRLLSENEIREQNVITLSAFLNELGITARKFGRFDEAMRSFLEIVEIQRQEGDSHLEAVALSDIGYIYQHNGEFDQARQFLHEAIRTEEQNGPSTYSQRWRMQLTKMGDSAVHYSIVREEHDTAGHDLVTLDFEIEDASAAYMFTEQAMELAIRGNDKKAISLANRVLRWAIGQRDVHCQVVCRNIMGICHNHLGNHKDAVSEYQKGIQLADGGGGGTALSLGLRYNLAKTYFYQDGFQNCADVLQAGIAYSQMALTRTDSFALRQKVISGALPLYELFAFLLSRVDAPVNHEHLLALTDVVRARNMAAWAQIQAEFESATASKDVADRVDEQLRQLRAVEVELDLRHLANALTSSEATALQQKSDTLQKQIEETAIEHGVQIQASITRKSWAPFEEMEDSLANVLSPGTAILSLFCVPEGICPSLFCLDGNNGLKSRGSIIGWDHTDRDMAFSRWLGETAFLRSRSTRLRSNDDMGVQDQPDLTDNSAEHSLNEFLRLVEEHFFEEIIPVIEQFRPHRLVIIPHRELALIPYWRLFDYCESIDAITMVPSLNLLRICINRSRKLKGTTIVVPDVTDTLPRTSSELAMVRSVRKTAFETVASVNQLIKSGPKANLLHIAAHGAFNSENPYYSGYLMDTSEHAPGPFDQYVRLGESNGETFFQFSSSQQNDSFRLMTVADCMAKLSLKECRLAVLSACDCGLSDSHGGGELTGLPTSLLVAGAKSVIAPLWPVDDIATELLMGRFYNHWAGGSGENPSPAKSLALARDDLKKMTRFQVLDLVGWDTCIPDGDHPFSHQIYSDAFHCFGDW